MKPFTFYDIYYAPIKEMDDSQAGKFFHMICDFLDGKQVAIDAERDEEISPEFELYWESILSDLETYRNSAGKSCGLDKRYKHFPFLPFYRKAFAYLSDDEGGAFVKMIGAYMFENKAPTNMFENKAPTKAESNAFKYFLICKRKLDESKQRMQNGAKGGRPKKIKIPPQEYRVPKKYDTSARKENGNHS